MSDITMNQAHEVITAALKKAEEIDFFSHILNTLIVKIYCKKGENIAQLVAH